MLQHLFPTSFFYHVHKLTPQDAATLTGIFLYLIRKNYANHSSRPLWKMPYPWIGHEVAENLSARAMRIALQSNVYILHDLVERILDRPFSSRRSHTVVCLLTHLNSLVHTYTTPVRCCRINNSMKAANLALGTTGHLRYWLSLVTAHTKRRRFVAQIRRKVWYDRAEFYSRDSRFSEWCSDLSCLGYDAVSTGV